MAISDDYLDLVIGELLGRPPSWPELAAELRAARDRTGRRLRGEPESAAAPPLIENLPHANPEFVGREGVLEELRRLLANGQAAAITQARAITGLGGVGKTQTALAYAWRHRAEYRLIWWLRSETTAGLAADYAGMAEFLGLDPATPEQAKLIAAVRTRLEAMPGWLLVFDNAEEPAALTGLSAPAGRRACAPHLAPHGLARGGPGAAARRAAGGRGARSPVRRLTASMLQALRRRAASPASLAFLPLALAQALERAAG